jgi:hypothetical protein
VTATNIVVGILGSGRSVAKLAWIVLLCLWFATFGWMTDFEKRQIRNGQLDDLRWKAQIEAFGVHATAINKNTDLLVRMVKQ